MHVTIVGIDAGFLLILGGRYDPNIIFAGGTRQLTTKTPPSWKSRTEHFPNIEKLGNPGRRNFLWILEKNKTPPEAKFFEKQQDPARRRRKILGHFEGKNNKN